jgi:glycosyltransferase involved in cell wall biosynthesis
LKKIIVICHNYEPAYVPREPDAENRFYTYGFGGGMGRNIKKYLKEYEVEVWRLDAYTKGYFEKELSGLRYRIFSSLHLKNVFDFSFKFLNELKKEVKKTDPILVVAHTHYWLAYQVAFFFKKSGIVTTHHGEWSPFFRVRQVKGLRKLKALIEIQMEKLVFRNIDYILTCDRKQVALFKRAYPDIKYVIWSSGVIIENLKLISKQEACMMLGWDLNKKYILYVGKLYRYKQADELIRTWKEIQKERPEVELVIVGSENDKWEEFYSMAVESGAKLAGRVLNTELYKYYCASDVFVMFALRNDFYGGTGIAPLESLACNTPVVSYALRNYIGDNVGEIGEVPQTVAEYKQAILKVLDNPGHYKNMRESILKYYAVEAVYKNTGKIFDELYENK